MGSLRSPWSQGYSYRAEKCNRSNGNVTGSPSKDRRDRPRSNSAAPVLSFPANTKTDGWQRDDQEFHVLYVGQIELDNIGLDGTPANERRYSDERLREAFATAKDVAQLMDDLGFEALWTAEHHFQREGYEVLSEPDPARPVARDADQAAQVRLRLQRAADVASDPAWPRTTRWPTSSPTAASSWASAAAITRARWRRSARRCSTPEANRELFEEQVELLLKCFNEEPSSHKGKHYECPPPVDYRGYTLNDITMVPRPKHLPVEIWMPIASGKTIDMMARYGLKAMVTLNGEKILDDVVRAYHAACAKHGREKKLGEDMIWGSLTESESRGRRAIRLR